MELTALSRTRLAMLEHRSKFSIVARWISARPKGFAMGVDEQDRQLIHRNNVFPKQWGKLGSQ